MLKTLKKSIKFINESDGIPKDRIRMFTYFESLYKRKIISDADIFYWIDRYIPYAIDKTEDNYYKDFNKAREQIQFVRSEILRLKTEIDSKYEKYLAVKEYIEKFTSDIYKNSGRKPWYSMYYLQVLIDLLEDKDIHILNAAITLKQRMKLVGFYYETIQEERAEQIIWN